jgi:catechol 2,3-dioxygenase-like lactoylglutathione lyase family enzyme
MLQLDSVQIGVADLDGAARAYALLLGVAPIDFPHGVRRFQLGRGAVELEAGDPGVHSIRFICAPGVRTTRWPTGREAYYGLAVVVEEAEPAASSSFPIDAADAIDHVVVRTPNPDRAIALWRDRLGLRLAFDREFSERGLRLVFFRSGGITLEFACSSPPPSDPSGTDQFYGLSYRVHDLEARRARLVAAGVDVSAIRPGFKPGTAVATVRSGTAGEPTLLLEDSNRQTR